MFFENLRTPQGLVSSVCSLKKTCRPVSVSRPFRNPPTCCQLFYIRTNYWKTTRLKLILIPEQFEKLLSLKIICKSTQNLFNRYIFANMPCVPTIKSHLWCSLLKKMMSNYLRWDVSFASQYWFNRLICGNITQHVLKIYDKLSEI